MRYNLEKSTSYRKITTDGLRELTLSQPWLNYFSHENFNMFNHVSLLWRRKLPRSFARKFWKLQLRFVCVFLRMSNHTTTETRHAREMTHKSRATLQANICMFCFKTIEQEGCYANKAYVGICHTQAISAARSFSSTDVRHITTPMYYLVFCDITYSQKSD